MRDVALNLFWVNRFAMTMYDKRPTRWRDVPRNRDDVFLPVLHAVAGRGAQGRRGRASLRRAAGRLGRARSRTGSSRCCSTCSGTGASTPPSCRPSSPRSPRSSPSPTQPDLLRWRLRPRLPGLRLPRRSSTAREDVAELEALHRWAMVLHNQYPWDRAQTRLTPVGELRDDDYVVVVPPAQPRGARLHPTSVTRGGAPARAAAWAPRTPSRSPSRRSGPTRRCACAKRFAVLPQARGAGRGARASACAPTTTSSATPPTAGRR